MPTSLDATLQRLYAESGSDIEGVLERITGLAEPLELSVVEGDELAPALALLKDMTPAKSMKLGPGYPMTMHSTTLALLYRLISGEYGNWETTTLSHTIARKRANIRMSRFACQIAALAVGA